MNMFTDMHNHFVYGVDDGCADPGTMLNLLHALEADQVSEIISTAHITPGQVHFPMDMYRAHFAEAQEMIRQENLHLTIYPGNEILYTDMTPRYLREGKALTLADSEYALIEFMPGEKYERLCEAAQKVRNAGYDVIFAHIERYACLSDVRRVIDLKDRYGVLMQVNCSLFAHKQSFLRKRWIKALMKDELVDMVSTDTHDMPGREPAMAPCFDALKRDYGEETALYLTRDHARELLLSAPEADGSGR